MKKKKILIHTHFHKRRTGVTVSLENILPHLSGKVKTYIYGYGLKWEKLSFSKLIKILTQKGTEVIVHTHRNNEILFFLALRLLGFRFFLVFTRHAETKPSSLTLFLMKKADQVISLTTSMKEKLSIDSKVVEHGVNTNLFKPNENARINEFDQPNIIVCAGRIRKAKGQKVLLEALAPILSKHKDWALIFLGKVDKEEYMAELKSLISENKVEAQVYFPGEVAEIETFYQSAKVAVVASFTEGFSLTCLEAMACECTVFATEKVGVHSDLIKHKKNGYLFPVGDVNTLRKLLHGLIKIELPQLGKEARAEIEKNWSASNEAEKLASIYRGQ